MKRAKSKTLNYRLQAYIHNEDDSRYIYEHDVKSIIPELLSEYGNIYCQTVNDGEKVMFKVNSSVTHATLFSIPVL